MMRCSTAFIMFATPYCNWSGTIVTDGRIILLTLAWCIYRWNYMATHVHLKTILPSVAHFTDAIGKWASICGFLWLFCGRHNFTGTLCTWRFPSLWRVLAGINLKTNYQQLILYYFKTQICTNSSEFIREKYHR